MKEMRISMKILVVEDERDLNSVIVRYLKKSNFSVDSAYNGSEAMDYIEATTYDLVLLDIMMPQMDGYSLLERLRTKKNDTPVIFLTAKDALEDKVKGLNIGADDYIIKPFSFDELIARINAVIRRNYGNRSTNIVIGDVDIDTTLKTVKVNEHTVELTAKEYAVLEYLMQNKERVLSREQIRQHAWDFDYEGESNIIDVIIKNIRRKIGEHSDKQIIFTKRGMGYVIREK